MKCEHGKDGLIDVCQDCMKEEMGRSGIDAEIQVSIAKCTALIAAARGNNHKLAVQMYLQNCIGFDEACERTENMLTKLFETIEAGTAITTDPKAILSSILAVLRINRVGNHVIQDYLTEILNKTDRHTN